MKASEVIGVLQRLIESHGDLPCEDYDGMDIDSVYIEYAESDVDNAFVIENSGSV